MADLQLGNALFQRIAYAVNTLLVDKVDQTLGLFPGGAEHAIHYRLPQSLQCTLQPAIGGIEGAQESPEFLLPVFVCLTHAFPQPQQDADLLGDAAPQKSRLGRQDDGLFVQLSSVGGQVVGAEDEGHGGEGALGGEEVFDEGLDGDIVDFEIVVFIIFIFIFISRAVASTIAVIEGARAGSGEMVRRRYTGRGCHLDRFPSMLFLLRGCFRRFPGTSKPI